MWLEHLCKSSPTKPKSKWMKDRTTEAEDACNSGNSTWVFQVVKFLVGEKRMKSGLGTNDDNGNMLYSNVKVKKRWRKYCTNL